MSVFSSPLRSVFDAIFKNVPKKPQNLYACSVFLAWVIELVKILSSMISVSEGWFFGRCPMQCRSFSISVSNLTAYNKLHKVTFLSLAYTLKLGCGTWPWQSFECKDYPIMKPLWIWNISASTFLTLRSCQLSLEIQPFFSFFLPFSSFFSPSFSWCE